MSHLLQHLSTIQKSTIFVTPTLRELPNREYTKNNGVLGITLWTLQKTRHAPSFLSMIHKNVRPGFARPGTKIHVHLCHHSNQPMNQRIRFHTYQTTLGFALPVLDSTLHSTRCNCTPTPICHPTARPLPPRLRVRTERRWLSHAIQGWYWPGRAG